MTPRRLMRVSLGVAGASLVVFVALMILVDRPPMWPMLALMALTIASGGTIFALAFTGADREPQRTRITTDTRHAWEDGDRADHLHQIAADAGFAAESIQAAARFAASNTAMAAEVMDQAAAQLDDAALRAVILRDELRALTTARQTQNEGSRNVTHR